MLRYSPNHTGCCWYPIHTWSVFTWEEPERRRRPLPIGALPWSAIYQRVLSPSPSLFLFCVPSALTLRSSSPCAASVSPGGRGGGSRMSKWGPFLSEYFSGSPQGQGILAWLPWALVLPEGKRRLAGDVAGVLVWSGGPGGFAQVNGQCYSPRVTEQHHFPRCRKNRFWAAQRTSLS